MSVLNALELPFKATHITAITTSPTLLLATRKWSMYMTGTPQWYYQERRMAAPAKWSDNICLNRFIYSIQNVYTDLYLAYTSRGLTADTTTQIFDWFIEQQDGGLVSVSHRNDDLILVCYEEYEAIFCDFEYYENDSGWSKYWVLDTVGAK
ncbi:hypothetical protein DXG01_007730 [Tephrocybe rancida]|nr:hypothetical protein DXG01_007730 [Tephrocybe rancida]